MAQVDQELPRRESRHGRARGLDVVKVVRLQGKVAGRRSDVLGVAAALEPGETQETEHLVADGEVADVLAHARHHAGDVGPGNRGQGERWPQVLRDVGHALTHVPVGRIQPRCAHPNQELVRLRCRPGNIVEGEDAWSTVGVQSDGLHCGSIHLGTPRI